MRVVVVGGGFAGLSAAARLAKLRHDVVLLESGAELGGRLRPIRLGTGAWHLTPPSFTLPGSVRDLFRKSGRTLEQTVELVTVDRRRHVFDDRAVLDLPVAPRSGQHDAIDGLLGEDLWSPFVDSLDDVWEVLRRRTLDVVPTGPDDLGREDRRVLGGRRGLKRGVHRRLKDHRLRELVMDPVLLDGEDPRWLPVAEAVWPYVERTFGRHRPRDGFETLADAMADRMGERRVDVRLGVRALEVEGAASPEHRGPRDVVTTDGTLAADVVVWAAGPVPGVSQSGLLPRIPAARTLVELSDVPDVPREIATHGRPPMHLWTEDGRRWTIAHLLAEDPLTALVRVGIDWRDNVVERHDLAPRDLVQLGHWGWQWMGRRTRFDRPARVGPGLYAAGAAAHPGTSIELIAMGTAAIAEEIGAVPR